MLRRFPPSTLTRMQGDVGSTHLITATFNGFHNDPNEYGISHYINLSNGGPSKVDFKRKWGSGIDRLRYALIWNWLVNHGLVEDKSKHESVQLPSFMHIEMEECHPIE